MYELGGAQVIGNLLGTRGPMHVGGGCVGERAAHWSVAGGHGGEAPQAPIDEARASDAVTRRSPLAAGQAGCATDWLWLTQWPTHSPVICRVAALMRFQALIAAIATTSPASCDSS